MYKKIQKITLLKTLNQFCKIVYIELINVYSIISSSAMLFILTCNATGLNYTLYGSGNLLNDNNINNNRTSLSQGSQTKKATALNKTVN